MTHMRLRDGTCVLIRSIRPDDKELLTRGFERLSQETVQRRFLSAKSQLSPAELRYLTEVDGEHHVALVAVLAAAPHELAGVGRFVRLPDDPATAEVAVTIADCHQSQGLGRRLGLMLADEARARGILRFAATMHGDNVPAYRLMETISRRLSRSPHQDGTQALVADLAA